jgi:hypothetical protein
MRPRLNRDRKPRQRLDLVDGSAALGPSPCPGPPEHIRLERCDCAVVVAEAVYIAEVVCDVRERARLDYTSVHRAIIHLVSIAPESRCRPGRLTHRPSGRVVSPNRSTLSAGGAGRSELPLRALVAFDIPGVDAATDVDRSSWSSPAIEPASG